jgi:adenylate kinase
MAHVFIIKGYQMACFCRYFCSWSNIILFIVILGTAYLVYLKFQQPVPGNQIKRGKTIFVFLGAPGSGKGTLAQRVVQEFGYKQLSTGDLCRDNIKRGTDLGKKLQEYTSKGSLVPDDIISAMAKEWLDVNTKDGKNIILDGYPRTACQAEFLLNATKSSYPDYTLRVVSLNVSDDVVVERLGGRLMCSNKDCGAIYNVKQFVGVEKPMCTRCGSPLIKREDDKEEVIRERLKVYAQTSQALRDVFKKAGIVIEEINVEGKGPQEVFEVFKKMIA